MDIDEEEEDYAPNRDFMVHLSEERQTQMLLTQNSQPQLLEFPKLKTLKEEEPIVLKKEEVMSEVKEEEVIEPVKEEVCLKQEEQPIIESNPQENSDQKE